MQPISFTDSAIATESAKSSQTAAAAAKLEAAKGNRTEIREAAEQFESIFIGQMLGHMFKGIGTNSLFGGGQAEGIYRDLMIDEYGKQVVSSGGLGLADTIERQLLSLQEVK